MKRLLSMLVLGLAVAMPQAHAGMIATDAAQAGDERARVRAMLARPELAREIERMGIAPQEAAERVDAMTEAEVRSLAGRLDALPAGAQVSDRNLLLLILLILLIVIIV
ncbi:MAG TPA: PA2779 family protein [Burkholderiales bacterium]|jgi:hypothetical protein|nr:PA2779 family protein [Burkholderiales bacterium]